MSNGKFFSGLPERMMTRNRGPDRQKSNFFWPEEYMSDPVKDAPSKKKDSNQQKSTKNYNGNNIKSPEITYVEPTNHPINKNQELSSKIQFYDYDEKPKNNTNRSDNKMKSLSSKIDFHDNRNHATNITQSPQPNVNSKVDTERNSKNSPKTSDKRISFVKNQQSPSEKVSITPKSILKNNITKSKDKKKILKSKSVENLSSRKSSFSDCDDDDDIEAITTVQNGIKNISIDTSNYQNNEDNTYQLNNHIEMKAQQQQNNETSNSSHAIVNQHNQHHHQQSLNRNSNLINGDVEHHFVNENTSKRNNERIINENNNIKYKQQQQQQQQHQPIVHDIKIELNNDIDNKYFANNSYIESGRRTTEQKDHRGTMNELFQSNYEKVQSTPPPSNTRPMLRKGIYRPTEEETSSQYYHNQESSRHSQISMPPTLTSTPFKRDLSPDFVDSSETIRSSGRSMNMNNNTNQQQNWSSPLNSSNTQNRTSHMTTPTTSISNNGARTQSSHRHLVSNISFTDDSPQSSIGKTTPRNVRSSAVTRVSVGLPY